MLLLQYIFSRPPVPGRCKTRLIPALGERGAARLQQKMTEWMVSEAVASRVGGVTLYAASDCDHPLFTGLQRRFQVELRPQQGVGLGERMSNAIEHGLEHGDGVILMGSDAPALNREILHQVSTALRHHPVVFVPALDGGYALVAMRQFIPDLFIGIEWGGSDVLSSSVAILRRQNIDSLLLEPVADIDLPQDLKWVPAHWLDEIDGVISRNEQFELAG